MTNENRRQTETHLLEALLSALDARESAKHAGSPFLVHLADMLVELARQELNRPDPIGEGRDRRLPADTLPQEG